MIGNIVKWLWASGDFIEAASMSEIPSVSEPQRGHKLTMTDVDSVESFDPRRVPKEEVKPWEEWDLNEDFEIGKALADGQFGHVYLARTKREKFVVALKVIHIKQIEEDGLVKHINREIVIHVHLDHENIIKMYGNFQDDDKLIFVLEFAPGGDVYTELLNQPQQRFDDEKSATYIYQLTNALEYLHNRGIIHRDIKPENLLIGSYGEIKMADFGCSIKTSGSSSNRKTVCDTLEYLAPEMVQVADGGTGTYDKSVDLWCLGVLAFEFLVGKPPFESTEIDHEMRREAMYGQIRTLKFEFPTWICSDAKDFINKLLTDPEKRMSLSSARTHDWCHLNKSQKKKLIPMFDKLAHLEPEMRARYDVAQLKSFIKE